MAELTSSKIYGKLEVSRDLQVTPQHLLSDSTDRPGTLEISEISDVTWSGIQIKRNGGKLWTWLANDTQSGFYDDENSDWFLQFNEDLGVTLYHNALARFETTASGVTVTGRTTTAGVTSSSSILLASSGTQDIGASGANYWRHGYFSGTVYSDDSLSLNWTGTPQVLDANSTGIYTTSPLALGTSAFPNASYDLLVAADVSIGGNLYVNAQTLSVTDSAVIVNDLSLDIDFRVETNNKVNGLLMDAALDKARFGARVVVDSSTGTQPGEFKARVIAMGDDVIISSTSLNLTNEWAFDARWQTASNTQGTGIKFSVGNTNAYPATGAIACNRTGSFSQGEMLFAVKRSTTGTDTSIGVNYSIHGTTNRASWWNGNGTEEIRFNLSTGQGDFNGDVVGYSTLVSDVRLKENIKPLENSLDKVLQLEGVSYNRKSNGDFHLGYIAQDVEVFMPDVIAEKPLPLETGDEETLFKTLRYQEIIPYLSGAIKEQHQIITDQQKEIDELKSQIAIIIGKLNS